MSIPVWTEIVCRKCAHHIVGDFTRKSSLQKRFLLKNAKSRGAVFKHDEVFCDEECLRSFEVEDLNEGGQP